MCKFQFSHPIPTFFTTRFAGGHEGHGEMCPEFLKLIEAAGKAEADFLPFEVNFLDTDGNKRFAVECRTLFQVKACHSIARGKEAKRMPPRDTKRETQ